jgi:hypothetical protein
VGFGGLRAISGQRLSKQLDLGLPAVSYLFAPL